MRKILFGLCLMLAAAVWAAELCPAAAPDRRTAGTIAIGFIGPESGELAPSTKEARQVLALLAADVNAQGGLLGRQVVIVSADDGDKADSAVAAGKKLAAQGVAAVIGSLRSGITEPLQGVFNEARIVHISNGSTAPSLMEKGYKYFFRTCPQDGVQAKIFVNYIRKTGIKKVAVLHDGSLYGRELAERINRRLFEWMIDPVYYGSLTPGLTDYAPALAKVRAAGPELVFYAGYHTEAARLLAARERMNWKVAMMGGDGTNNRNLAKLAGVKAAEGFSFISPPVPADLASPRAKQFLARYEKAYGEPLTAIQALFAGDAFGAVVESIAKTKSTDAARMADYLHRRYYNPAGLTGVLYFDYRGDVVNDLHGVYRVDGSGRFVLQRLVEKGRAVK
jgi:branched-chain amino acid transport system substrate-binding protein